MDDYNDIFTYLESKEYPNGFSKNQKRVMRRRCKDFQIKRGLLYYTSKADTGGECRQVPHSHEEAQRIIKSCHDEGHQGRDKTYELVSKRFYWKSLWSDVQQYVQYCVKCQVNNDAKFSKKTASLHPIPVKSKVWNQIGIDLIGPLPQTKQGYRYIITLVDFFSKWPEAAPLHNKSASSVALFLYRMICRYGCPNVIISDQGREFVNKVSRHLFAITHTEHRISSAYHPQTNGLVERFNQTLQRSLVKLVNSNQSDWDEKLDGVLFAYRTAPQKSTKLTPFQLMYCRKAVLPIEHELRGESDTSSESIQTLDNYIDEMATFRENLFSEAKGNIKVAQTKQKRDYDKKHAQKKSLSPGSLVLLRNSARDSRKGDKMSKRWFGPYIVHEELGKGLYKLKNRKTKKLIKKAYNICRLKLFFERNQFHLENDDLYQKFSPEKKNSSVEFSDISSSLSPLASPSPNLDQSISSVESFAPTYKRRKVIQKIFLDSSTTDLESISNDTPLSSPGLDLPVLYPSASPIHSSSPQPKKAQCSPKASQPNNPQLLSESPLLPENPVQLRVTAKTHSSSIQIPANVEPSQPTLNTHNSTMSKKTALHCMCKQRCGSRKCPCKKEGNACQGECHPGRQCINVTQQPIAFINLTDTANELSAQKENCWVKIGAVSLTFDDEDALKNRSHKWLNDNHITGAQNLLKSQHPHINGLQPPVLQITRTLEVHCSKPFVQILNMSQNHWITVSTIGCAPGIVKVYDSMHLRLPSSLKQIIADLMFHNGHNIKVQYINMQTQVGLNDCGLFAIASATAICHDIDPSAVDFCQKDMRGHLRNSFEQGQLLPFPTKHLTEQRMEIYAVDTVKIYCLCRQINDKNRQMVECTSCKNWFHLDCLKVPKNVIANKTVPWYCKSCCVYN